MPSVEKPDFESARISLEKAFRHMTGENRDWTTVRQMVESACIALESYPDEWEYWAEFEGRANLLVLLTQDEDGSVDQMRDLLETLRDDYYPEMKANVAANTDPENPTRFIVEE